MNGQNEMDANQLFELLQSTQIEEFDAVEEAFKLLDVDDKKFLSIETFKNIFEKLKLGTIEVQDEEIFKEVADFDGDGQISLEDFKKILTYDPAEDEDDGLMGPPKAQNAPAIEIAKDDEEGSEEEQEGGQF
jgi:Ca2+-binding EF-hand superfamily protein